MSVFFNQFGEGLLRTTGLVPVAGDCTYVFWFRHDTTPSGGRGTTVFSGRNNAYTQYFAIFGDINTNNFLFNADNGSAAVTSSIKVLTLGQWYPMAYVRQGNNHLFYVDGILIDTESLDISGITFDRLEIGDDTGPSGTDNHVAYWREYDRALTLNELIAEWSSATVVDNTNLNADCPFQANPNDISGNGNNFTNVLTPTYTNNVPLVNTSSVTATDIGSVLPYNATQNVVDGSGVAQTVWYKFTPNFTGVIGLWFYGDIITYLADTRVFSPDASTTYLGLSSVINKRIQIPVNSGVTYWFRIQPSGVPTTSILTINVVRGPSEAYPAGTIAVPQDFVGFPMVLISPTVDFEVLNFVNDFPAGEAADILANGNILTDDFDDFILKVFDSSFNLVTNTGISIGGALTGKIRTNRATQKWWAVNGANPGVARRFSSTGTVEVTETITGFADPDCIAANNADTILYLADSDSTNKPVRRWDLVGHAFLSDLAAGIANYTTGFDILVLEDDTILVQYVKTSAVIDVIVRRYDTSGTILNTYSFGSDHLFPGGTFPRLAYALDSPNSFWHWSHLSSSPGVSLFQNVKISDGSILGDVRQQEYEAGVYQSPVTATPTTEFGVPFSCPFFILPLASSTGTIIVNKVTVPADSTLFDIVASGGTITPTNYQLSNGTSQTHSGLAPGTYSITETPNALYDTVIAVDNGDPNTAIDVGAGETVTVTITNTLKSAINATLLVLKMTDPLNTTFLFDFTAGGGAISPTSFALHSEETILFHVAPGTYSIVEDSYLNFKTTYMIDNDPTGNNLAIVVGAGENISVGVLNEAFGGGLFFPNPEVPPGTPGTFPPGTGQPFDKVPDQNAGSVQVAIPWFAITGFIRDI